MYPQTHQVAHCGGAGPSNYRLGPSSVVALNLLIPRRARLVAVDVVELGFLDGYLGVWLKVCWKYDRFSVKNVLGGRRLQKTAEPVLGISFVGSTGARKRDNFVKSVGVTAEVMLGLSTWRQRTLFLAFKLGASSKLCIV